MSDHPATKRDLEEAVAPLATRAELAPLATKDELAAAVAKLATNDELAAAVAKLATKEELAAAVAKLEANAVAMEQRFVRYVSEATMHAANVMLENVRQFIAALDDKYRDLPARHATRMSQTLPCTFGRSHENLGEARADWVVVGDVVPEVRLGFPRD